MAEEDTSGFVPRDAQTPFFEQAVGLHRLTFLPPNRILITSRDPRLGTVEYLRPDRSGSAAHVFVPVTPTGEARPGAVMGLWPDTTRKQTYFFQASNMMAALTRKGAYSEQPIPDVFYCRADSVPPPAFLLSMIHYVKNIREDVTIPENPLSNRRMGLQIGHDYNSGNDHGMALVETLSSRVQKQFPAFVDRNLKQLVMVHSAKSTAAKPAMYYHIVFVCPGNN